MGPKGEKQRGPVGTIKLEQLPLRYLGGGEFQSSFRASHRPSPMPGDPARCFSHEQETPGLKRRNRAVCKPTGCSREVKVDHQVTRDNEPWAGGSFIGEQLCCWGDEDRVGFGGAWRGATPKCQII